jgi:hypothetical protein
MNTRLAISLLIAGALAFACGPRSHSEAPAALASALPITTSTPPAPEKITRHVNVRAPAKVEPHLDVQVAQRNVRFAFEVENIGAKHVEIDFANGQAYDFTVVDSVGRKVWRWSDGRLFTQGVQNKQLASGETMNAREVWKRAKPGRYTAIATLRSANYPVEQRADFVVH